MVTRCRRLVDHFPSEKRLWDVRMAIFRRAARGIFLRKNLTFTGKPRPFQPFQPFLEPDAQIPSAPPLAGPDRGWSQKIETVPKMSHLEVIG